MKNKKRYYVRCVKGNENITIKIKAEDKESAKKIVLHTYRVDQVLNISVEAPVVKYDLKRDTYPYVKTDRKTRSVRIFS